MLYISGRGETLKELRVKEGYTSPLDAYENEFAKQNPGMCSKYPSYKKVLPPYTPMFLVIDEASDPEHKKEILQELSTFSTDELKVLKELQESNADLGTQIAFDFLMDDYREYVDEFQTDLKTSPLPPAPSNHWLDKPFAKPLDNLRAVRDWLNAPVILTPWQTANGILKNKILPKTIAETTSFASKSLSSSQYFKTMDPLFEHMLSRDILNRQLQIMKDVKGSTVAISKANLEKQIKFHTAQIKQLLPKRLDSYMQKALSSKFTPSLLRKLRANCYSAKAARGGKLLTTDLDVLNKSGLTRLRSMIKGLKGTGQLLKTGVKVLNYGAVALDTYDAYENGGNIAKTFITGTLSVAATTGVVNMMGGTAAVGALVVNSIPGAAAFGVTVLSCTPVVGWGVLIVGIVASAAIGYGIKKLSEGVWDIAEDPVSNVSKQIYSDMMELEQAVKKAWNEKPSALLDFYGQKEPIGSNN